jgi:hypothetical protein
VWSRHRENGKDRACQAYRKNTKLLTRNKHPSRAGAFNFILFIRCLSRLAHSTTRPRVACAQIRPNKRVLRMPPIQGYRPNFEEPRREAPIGKLFGSVSSQWLDIKTTELHYDSFPTPTRHGNSDTRVMERKKSESRVTRQQGSCPASALRNVRQLVAETLSDPGRYPDRPYSLSLDLVFSGSLSRMITARCVCVSMGNRRV